MLYAVGVKGEGCQGPKQGPLLNKERFLSGVQRLAKRALEVVGTYNSDWAAGDPIEEVRWCLVSGGVYCHPAVEKLEVAAATIQGMREAAVSILVTFTYDEDVFRRAFDEERESARGLAGLEDKSKVSWMSNSWTRSVAAMKRILVRICLYRRVASIFRRSFGSIAEKQHNPVHVE